MRAAAHFGQRGVLAAVVAASILTAGASPALAADEAPSSQSPALVSTNANPTVDNGVTVPLDPRPGFRVLPYLQKPAATEMTINWFTELGSPATLTVTGPGLPAGGAAFQVTGVQNPVNDYQQAELTITGFDNKRGGVVPQGAWIRANSPFKYSQTVDGLVPGSTYEYTVSVDGYLHSAGFTTAPESGAAITDDFHVIAMSDAESDPKGRVTNREWEQTTTLAPGSEPRPEAGSAWDQTFGGGDRNGTYAVNYALTEDQGQFYNNQVVGAADPDLLLMPGDLVERGSSQSHWDEFFQYYSGDRGNILDDTPVITSLGNHEVYGYGTPDDRSLVVRSRMEYNQYFDTFGSSNPHAQDAYHRVDYGGVTFISLDVTNGEPDATVETVPASEASVGDDADLTPEQYGTDTQGVFTKDEYDRDFQVAIDEGWTSPDAQPDQPSFMPGSEQYVWFEQQLQQARDAGQVIIVQWHQVAYSNGVHGTPMGNDHPDEQPGVPTRHLQPLLEQYGVAAVLSGHDEMFQASYVDEDGDGVGVYHWDVGVTADGLRADKKVQLEDGSYVPYRFNTHEVWSAQVDQPELWQTNANGVKHLVSGGKHYGHLDMMFAPYTGAPLASGVTPAAQLTMTPVSVFPVLDDEYKVERIERVELTEGVQVVYFDAQGNVLDPNAAPGPTTEPTSTEPATTEPASTEPTTTEPAPTDPAPTDPAPTDPASTEPAATDDATTAPTSGAPKPEGTASDAADADGGLASTGGEPVPPVVIGAAAAALALGGWLAVRRRRA